MAHFAATIKLVVFIVILFNLVWFFLCRLYILKNAFLIILREKMVKSNFVNVRFSTKSLMLTWHLLLVRLWKTGHVLRTVCVVDWLDQPKLISKVTNFLTLFDFSWWRWIVFTNVNCFSSLAHCFLHFAGQDEFLRVRTWQGCFSTSKLVQWDSFE